MPGVSGIASSAPTPIPHERPDARNACCGMRMRASAQLPDRLPRCCWTQRIRRPILMAGLCASVVVLTASQADADIGVIGVKPNVGAPGQLINLAVGCGEAERRRPGHSSSRGGLRWPGMSAAVAGLAAPVGRCATHTRSGLRRETRPVQIANSAKNSAGDARTCSSAGPRGGARRRRTGQRYVLRFRVPRVKPGAYEFVVFCDACSPGPSGSLIATFTGPNSRRSLQVRSEQRSASNDGGADRAWLIAGAAALLASFRGRSRCSPGPAPGCIDTRLAVPGRMHGNGGYGNSRRGFSYQRFDRGFEL